MTSIASFEIIIGNKNDDHYQYLMNNTLSFKIPLLCPFCLDPDQRISTWGTYTTKFDERARFYCYDCSKSFNSAKIPFWKDNLDQMIWKLAQLSVEDKISIHSLSQKWNIPETSLRVLITEIKELLSSSFEQIKQLEEFQNIRSGKKPEEIKIIVYDEGFLKLLGIQAYLLFTLDGN
jgi:transposase-like protein